MDVVLRHVGQLEVDYVGQLVDIQAAGGDVGSDQNAQAVGLEVGQCLGTRALALVAVNRGSRQTVLDQVLGQAVGAVLGTGKDQHLLPGALGDQVRNQCTLVTGGNAVNLLVDALDRGVRRGDFDAGRVIEQLVRQIDNVLGEGGREQQVLAFGRQLGDDLFDVMDKAHVEHAVSFVEYQNLDLREVDGLLAHQIQQATRAGDQDIQAGGDGFHLRVGADAAEDTGGFQRQFGGVGADAVVHLGGQFAGRGQDQNAHLLGLGAVAVGLAVGEQAFDDRQGKAGGFAGAGLGGNHQVAAFENRRNRLLLYRRGCGVTSGRHRAYQRVGQPQRGKGHEQSCWAEAR